MLDLTIKQLKKIQEALHMLDSVCTHGEIDCGRMHGDLDASRLADEIGIVIRARETEAAFRPLPPGTTRIELDQ